MEYPQGVHVAICDVDVFVIKFDCWHVVKVSREVEVAKNKVIIEPP